MALLRQCSHLQELSLLTCVQHILYNIYDYIIITVPTNVSFSTIKYGVEPVESGYYPLDRVVLYLSCKLGHVGEHSTVDG